MELQVIDAHVFAQSTVAIGLGRDKDGQLWLFKIPPEGVVMTAWNMRGTLPAETNIVADVEPWQILDRRLN